MQKALTLTHTGIGKKALIALTGLILFGFVLAHLIGNLQVFLGREHINEYGEMLHSFPKLLWTARIVLLVSLVVHVALTVQLALRNSSARNGRYAMARDSGDQPWLLKYARKTMILSGPIVLFFVLFHLAHLTLGADVIPGYSFVEGDVYGNLVHGFRNPVVAGFYVFANCLLGLHLYHGGQSLLQSLGLRSRNLDTRVNLAASAFALFVTAGNVIIPCAILGGLIG